jgi:hypothetical protein
LFAGSPVHLFTRSPAQERSIAVTHAEILTGLFDNTVEGKPPAVKELTQQGLDTGLDPVTMLYEALLPALQEVGRRFEAGDFFVPEMLMSARAMQGALNLLRPLLAACGEQTLGKYVMGTVKGDVHDIGKNLCNIMLEGAGFEVIDLGVNVAPEKFVEAEQLLLSLRRHEDGVAAAGGLEGLARLYAARGLFDEDDANDQSQYPGAPEGRLARYGQGDGRRRAGNGPLRSNGRRGCLLPGREQHCPQGQGVDRRGG